MKHIIKLIEDGAWERALEEFLQYVDKEHIRSHSPEGGRTLYTRCHYNGALRTI